MSDPVEVIPAPSQFHGGPFVVRVLGRVLDYGLPKRTANTVADVIRGGLSRIREAILEREGNERPCYQLVDHVCMHCGGRILRRVTSSGPSPGGNPWYQCADCGRGGWEMGTHHLCWCGFEHRGGTSGGYRCVAYESADAATLEALDASGCRRDRGEIGVVSTTVLRDAQRRLPR